MTKSGTIFHAKHEDLTIVDKEYMKSCAKKSIDFEMADFLEKASARLDQIQSKQLTSIILELQEYQNKIEQGTLIELPCKIGDTCYFVYKGLGDMCRVAYKIKEVKIDNIHYIGDNEFFTEIGEYSRYMEKFGKEIFTTREEAEKRLKELQNK